ncbi:MAG: hypothetical protein F6K23_40025 [Okeania sp. SIO2C9]|uniref:hypothetical protein n=1 Tax=Okeania sp. SIO2C9 TaxID=2607791 RepID=UPI0013C20122|nr:hypothetical protein [Okeania sp. SIO2C9]NEQ78640.1 hypothetical protein [Okeania sp. SIO2C9]
MYSPAIVDATDSLTTPSPKLQLRTPQANHRDHAEAYQAGTTDTAKGPCSTVTSSPSTRHFSFSVPYALQLHHCQDCFAESNNLLADILQEGANKTVRTLVCIDAGVIAEQPKLAERISNWFSQRHQLKLVEPPLTIAAGEVAKSDWSVVEQVAEACERGSICRHSYIVVIGGGAVLDAVGLAASLVHRGVRLIRLPTTTLAQADAGLGVKNGINAYQNKNFIGNFAPPWAIINDASFLTSLPLRARRDGIIEAIKVAMIKDVGNYQWLYEKAPAAVHGDDNALQQIIERSALLQGLTFHIAHCAFVT